MPNWTIAHSHDGLKIAKLYDTKHNSTVMLKIPGLWNCFCSVLECKNLIFVTLKQGSLHPVLTSNKDSMIVES